MIQGGVLDHQRALDAVAQVASPSPLIDVVLGRRAADDDVQLCERIDGSSDIRHGVFFACVSLVPMPQPRAFVLFLSEPLSYCVALWGMTMVRDATFEFFSIAASSEAAKGLLLFRTLRQVAGAGLELQPSSATLGAGVSVCTTGLQ
jgi:hypothetical protein